MTLVLPGSPSVEALFQVLAVVNPEGEVQRHRLDRKSVV